MHIDKNHSANLVTKKYMKKNQKKARHKDGLFISNKLDIHTQLTYES